MWKLLNVCIKSYDSSSHVIADDQGTVTISNDGATIMKLLDIVHPAAKVLADISMSQDAEVRCAMSLPLFQHLFFQMYPPQATRNCLF